MVTIFIARVQNVGGVLSYVADGGSHISKIAFFFLLGGPYGMASIIPLKKRRGRKPNVLKHLIGKLPVQNKRKVTLQSNHQNKKKKSSKYRRKSKCSS